MLSFLFHVMASTAVNNTESKGSPGRKSRRLLPRMLKEYVTSLSKGPSPYDHRKESVSDLPGNAEGPSIRLVQKDHSPSSFCRAEHP